jgi:lipid-A-disaccharide synthase
LIASFRLFVSAGEASGDKWLAQTLQELRRQLPPEVRLEVAGLGGPRSEAQGLVSSAPLTSLAVNGIADVVRQAPRLLFAYAQALRAWKRLRPDAVLLVDYPGMNRHFWERAQKENLPVLVLAPPQLWSRQPDPRRLARWRRLAQDASIQVLFPFEADDWLSFGARVRQGHGFFNEPPRYHPTPPSESEPVLLLCPGSRPAAMRRNLAAWLKAWRGERDSLTESGRTGKPETLGVLVPEALRRQALQLATPYGSAIQVFSDLDQARLGSSSVEAICFPGTMTLELALAGIPFAALGLIDRWTWRWARRRVRVDHVALPNILLHRRLFPEWVGPPSDFALAEWLRLRAALKEVPRQLPLAHAELVAAMGPGSGGSLAARELLGFWERLRSLRHA